MKKNILLLAWCIVIVLPSYAQKNKDFDRLCEKYGNTENVETFGMNGLGCLLASWFVGKETDDVNALIRNCSSFRILTCEGEKSKELCKDIQAFIKDSRLEELLSVIEDETEVKIFIEDSKDVIRQVFIAVIEADREVVFLQVKGRFERSAVRKLVKTSEVSSL